MELWFSPDNDDFGIDGEIRILAKGVQRGLNRRRPVGLTTGGAVFDLLLCCRYPYMALTKMIDPPS